MFKHAIILPLKESFTVKNSGAVSIWVNDYIKSSKLKKEIAIIASKNNNKKDKYLKTQNLGLFLSSYFRKNWKAIKDI